MIERGEIVDLLVREGEGLALTQRQALRLTEVPTSILEFLTKPRSRAALEAHVAAEFGPPPPGRLDELLGELADQGLVKL